MIRPIYEVDSLEMLNEYTRCKEECDCDIEYVRLIAEILDPNIGVSPRLTQKISRIQLHALSYPVETRHKQYRSDFEILRKDLEDHFGKIARQHAPPKHDQPGGSQEENL